MNYLNEVVCKAIELLVTCKLAIFGLKSHFRYDRKCVVAVAVIHLKQDGRRNRAEKRLRKSMSCGDNCGLRCGLIQNGGLFAGKTQPEFKMKK